MQLGEERRRAVCGRTACTVRGGGGRHKGSVGNAARPERLPPTLLTFRPRGARRKNGELFTSFLPAVSDDAAKKIRHTIRRWRIHLWSGTHLTEIAREINQVVRGWINHYGRFYPSWLAKSLRRIDEYLVRWAMRKFKRLKRHRKRAWAFLANVFAREPKLFAHWRVVRASDRTVGAV
jgi:RNA-directed DNA polymerase